jgi:tetratricopeptide (TPR) repeat protein
MDGYSSGPLGVLSVVFVPVKITYQAVRTLPNKIGQANNKIYDFLTPNALQRRIAMYSTILALKNDPSAAHWRGVVYFLAEEFDSALTDFQNSINWSTSDTTDHNNYYYIGLIQNRLANYSEAVEAYTSALETFVQHEKGKNRFQRVQGSLRKKKRNLSRKSHMITETIITKLSVHDSLNVISKQKERERVEDEMDALFATPIHKSDILNNRGLANLNAGNFEDAITDLKNAGTTEHHYVFNLGLAYYYSNDLQNAKSCFRQAISMTSTSEVPSAYHIYCACTHERLGEIQDAQRERRIVLQREPDRNLYPFHFRLIPEAVFIHALSFLDFQTLTEVALACRTLRNIVYSPTLWTSYRFNNINTERIKMFLERSKGYMTELVLLYSDLRTVERLEEFKANKLLAVTMHYIPNDPRVSIHLSNFTKNNDLTRLERLEIVNCALTTITDLLNPINLSNVTSLTLIGVSALTQEHFHEILTYCKKLTYLFVAMSSWLIDNMELLQIVEKCPHLKMIVTRNPIVELVECVHGVKVIALDTSELEHVRQQHRKIFKCFA